MENQWLSFAQSQCSLLLYPLRSQFIRTLEQLKAKYTELEEEACLLSQDLEKNISQYQNKLYELSWSLEHIIFLENNPHYEQVIRFIQQMDANFRQLSQLLSPKEIQIEESLESKEWDEVISRITKLPPLHPLDPIIAALKLEFDQLIFNDPQYAHQLCNIFRCTYELSAQIDMPDSLVSLTSLRDLQILHYHVRQAGEGLLRHLLEEKEFDLAERLHSFHFVLDKQDLIRAFELQDAFLLDFLLKTKQFPINGQPLIIHGEAYASAVHYCDKKPYLMRECLSVLIANNASILVHDEQGLPIAYNILSSPFSPLKEALLRNADKTSDSIEFNKELMASLLYYIAQNPLLDKERAAIQIAIKSYEKRLLELGDRKSVRSISSFFYNKIVQNNSLIFQKNNKTLHIDRLSNDPEYLALSEKRNILLRAVSPRLTHKQRLSSVSLKLKWQNEAAALPGFSEETSYERVKPVAIALLEKQINFLELRQALLNVLDKLKRPGSLKKREKIDLLEQKIHLDDALRFHLEEMDYMVAAARLG